MKRQLCSLVLTGDVLLAQGPDFLPLDLHEASQQKIGAILTTKQKQKLLTPDEKRRAWMGGRLPEPNPSSALNSGW